MANNNYIERFVPYQKMDRKFYILDILRTDAKVLSKKLISKSMDKYKDIADYDSESDFTFTNLESAKKVAEELNSLC